MHNHTHMCCTRIHKYVSCRACLHAPTHNVPTTHRVLHLLEQLRIPLPPNISDEASLSTHPATSSDWERLRAQVAYGFALWTLLLTRDAGCFYERSDGRYELWREAQREMTDLLRETAYEVRLFDAGARHVRSCCTILCWQPGRFISALLGLLQLAEAKQLTLSLCACKMLTDFVVEACLAFTNCSCRLARLCSTAFVQ